jgi:hypothetical protein
MADDIAMNFTSKIVALSSALAFALQIALALLMLRYFSPEEVGTFSVISQIGFFWTTLALAQAPLRLLANHGVSVLEEARLAWIACMKRFIWLFPIAAFAVWLSGMSFVSTLIWALSLSMCQLTWMIAQSMRLRMAGGWVIAWIRILPPLIAFFVTSLAIYFQWSGLVLLSAALLGYAIGAAWLFQAFLINTHSNFCDISVVSDTEGSTVSGISITTDDRPPALRIAHSLVDALLATVIVVMWQRVFGAQETGWMAAPLRMMGFVPAFVHMAWAQVVLAQPRHNYTNPLWVGLGGAAGVAFLGICCVVALETGWLGEEWQGVRPYLMPLALWQGSACLAAAFSHLPFQAYKARKYSWFCIAAGLTQGFILLLPIVCALNFSANMHFLLFGASSGIILILFALYLRSTSRLH